MAMTYDEFGARLRQIKAEFAKDKGREMETIEELEGFLTRRLMIISKAKSGAGRLKSLRGVIP